MNTMLINRNRIAAGFSFSGNGASVRSYSDSELNNKLHDLSLQRLLILKEA